MAVSGCATILSAPEEHSPRALASLQLTEQGRILLESGDPDNAISIFERAININPTNGQNYYYLSEAWLLKGDTIQAKEFNQLAEIHLEDDHEWMRRVLQQRERIEERKNQKSFMNQRTLRPKKSLMPWNGWRPCAPMSPTRENKWSDIIGITATFLGDNARSKIRMG